MEKEPLMVRCPVCKGETGVKVFEDTVLLNFPLTCLAVGGKPLSML